jgi:hypothetical protein
MSDRICKAMILAISISVTALALDGIRSMPHAVCLQPGENHPELTVGYQVDYHCKGFEQ